MTLLSSAQLESALDKLPGWTHKDDYIEKRYEFNDFSEAFAFLCRVALISERLNHHASWSGVYNTVKLRLSTHDEGGVTEKDISFATEAEALL